MRRSVTHTVNENVVSFNFAPFQSAEKLAALGASQKLLNVTCMRHAHVAIQTEIV